MFDALDGTFGRPGEHFDVFDADGEYLGEGLLPPASRFLGALGDTTICLEQDDLDRIAIVAYEMRVET